MKDLVEAVVRHFVYIGAFTNVLISWSAQCRLTYKVIVHYWMSELLQFQGRTSKCIIWELLSLVAVRVLQNLIAKQVIFIETGIGRMLLQQKYRPVPLPHQAECE